MCWKAPEVSKMAPIYRRNTKQRSHRVSSFCFFMLKLSTFQIHRFWRKLSFRPCILSSLIWSFVLDFSWCVLLLVSLFGCRGYRQVIPHLNICFTAFFGDCPRDHDTCQASTRSREFMHHNDCWLAGGRCRVDVGSCHYVDAGRWIPSCIGIVYFLPPTESVKLNNYYEQSWRNWKCWLYSSDIWFRSGGDILSIGEPLAPINRKMLQRGREFGFF